MRCCGKKKFPTLYWHTSPVWWYRPNPSSSKNSIIKLWTSQGINLFVYCSEYIEELWLYTWYKLVCWLLYRPENTSSGATTRKRHMGEKKNCYSICNEPPVEKRKRSVLSMFVDFPFYFFYNTGKKKVWLLLMFFLSSLKENAHRHPCDDWMLSHTVTRQSKRFHIVWCSFSCWYCCCCISF